MNVDPGDLRRPMAVQRGRIAGGTARGNAQAVADGYRRLYTLKAQRLLEVAVDMLRQSTEGHDVSIEATLAMAQRALIAVTELNDAIGVDVDEG